MSVGKVFFSAFKSGLVVFRVYIKPTHSVALLDLFAFFYVLLHQNGLSLKEFEELVSVLVYRSELIGLVHLLELIEVSHKPAVKGRHSERIRLCIRGYLTKRRLLLLLRLRLRLRAVSNLVREVSHGVVTLFLHA